MAGAAQPVPFPERDVDEEIHPYEYAALERECWKSRVYCAAVLEQAIARIIRESRLNVNALAEKLHINKTTMYRYASGKTCSYPTMCGMIALLEGFRQEDSRR